MTAFATPADLATYLQTATQAEADAGSPDVLDTAVAQQALDSASAAIRAACGWSITEETTTVTTDSSNRMLFLPSLHVTAVSATYNGGLPFAVSWASNGIVRLDNPWAWNAAVEVTYTHGYPEAPEAVRAVCLELAAASQRNPQELVSATYGNVTEVYGSGGQVTVDPETDYRLDPYRLAAFA